MTFAIIVASVISNCRQRDGGSLHKCPGCGSFYYIPIMGPVDVISMTQEEVKQRWPELKT